MSNTPQQVINVGAAVNDGTGESLRNAFNAVNNNFANIWAAGPVDSQVVITNNVVSTNVTNLDLILAANGIGNVNLSSTLLPNVANVYDIGSAAKPFSEIYGQYFYGNGRFLTGISGGNGGSGGTVYFSMAPPVSPQSGDIWIESDTGVQYLYFSDDTSNQWAEMEAYISFSGGTSNANVNLTDIQSNVLPSVTNTYNLGSPSQQWKSLYVSGNALYINNVPVAVVGNNLQFNGSNVLTANTPLTFSNLTVTNNLSVANNATVGSIYTDNYYYANGVPLGQGGGNLGNSIITAKQNVLSISKLNTPLVLAGNGIANIIVQSTVIPDYDSTFDLGSTANRFNSTYSRYFYGNGRFLTGIVSSNANVDLENIQSNVLPSTTDTYSLGAPSRQWKSLYLSGNTLYLNNIPIGINGSNLQFNGANVLTSNTALTFTDLTISNSVTVSNRATIGNIYSDNYFYANGVPFGQGGGNLGNSWITANRNTLSVNRLNTPLVLAGNGIANIIVQSSIIPDLDSHFDLGSNVNQYDSVFARYYYGNGRFLTGISGGNASTGNWAFTGNTIYNSNGGVIDNSDLSHGATAQISIPANGNTSPLSILNYYGNFTVTTANAPSYTKTLTYDYTGNLSVPGTVTAGNLMATGNIYIGNTIFTRTLTVGRATTPVTVPLASNNSFNVLTVGGGNVVVYTT